MTGRAAIAAARPVIYVDGSHEEAMGRDPWGENGIGRFMRVLADNGYLPLVAPDLSPARLSRAAMLISIAPAHAFSPEEIAAVHGFVAEGGLFLSMVGKPDAEPGGALLDELGLRVDPAPLPPWDLAGAGAAWQVQVLQQARARAVGAILCRLARFQLSPRGGLAAGRS